MTSLLDFLIIQPFFNFMLRRHDISIDWYLSNFVATPLFHFCKRFALSTTALISGVWDETCLCLLGQCAWKQSRVTQREDSYAHTILFNQPRRATIYTWAQHTQKLQLTQPCSSEKNNRINLQEVKWELLAAWQRIVWRAAPN
jgi:hypothetical protein